MNILIPSPHCPIDCHYLWNFPHLPKHSGHHPDLGTSVSASCCFSHSCLAACSWKSPSPSPSTPSVLLSEWPFFFFFLHHELVRCIELYCHHIVNSFKLISPLHIKLPVTNFIWSYFHQFFYNFHGLKTSLKPLKKPFNLCQSCLKAINNGRDIKQINW